MKTSERHHLKENEFALTVASVSETVAANQRTFTLAAAAVLVVAIAGGGYWYWQRQQIEKASALLAGARAVATAPVTAMPTINQPAVTPQGGSFTTEQARDEAALKKFQEAAAAYPDTQPGLEARYQAAGLLSELGKVGEAEQAYNDVVRRDGNGLYGRMARLGVAAIQLRAGKVDPAIQTLQELSQRTDTDLPVDGILMQLGDAYRRAGRTPEAVRAYTRVVDEFPESAYVSDARSEIDQLKAQPAAAPTSK
jgi:predicted negative regulator of RcsB-dependent stress response